MDNFESGSVDVTTLTTVETVVESQTSLKEDDYAQSRTRILAATTMIGQRVRNAACETMGKVEDVMIDLETGRVAYVVLSFGGFMGLLNKLFAVPIEILHFDLSSKEFVLDLDREFLKNAPGFDKNKKPDFSNTDFENQIRSYYGKTSAENRVEPPRH